MTGSITDGEITLRPVSELIELIRYARDVGLIPMLMTHGDSFRRRPGLLERLMTEGGLAEISLHVDTTQRGRSGAAYRCAVREEELTPLRDELASLVRSARRATGLPLRSAMTMTVTRENLAGAAARDAKRHEGRRRRWSIIRRHAWGPDGRERHCAMGDQAGAPARSPPAHLTSLPSRRIESGTSSLDNS